MKRIERMHAILLQLQSKKIVTAQEVANHFGISLRTIYRDIRSLEESGVPIGAEAGIGYFLNESYTLPPVMFTTEEAFALITAAPFMKSMTSENTNKSFNNALLKIKAIVPNHQKERIATLESRISVKTGISQNPTTNESAFLFSIQQALADSKKLNIKYHAANGSSTSRQIEPLTLCYYMLKWHLIAHCTLRNEVRDFRLDRILALEISPETFLKSDFSIDNHFQKGMDQEGWQQITILVNKEHLTQLEITKYWYGFMEQNETTEGVEMRFLNPDLTYFAKWLISISPSPKVLEPQELTVNIKQLVTKLAKQYL